MHVSTSRDPVGARSFQSDTWPPANYMKYYRPAIDCPAVNTPETCVTAYIAYTLTSVYYRMMSNGRYR